MSAGSQSGVMHLISSLNVGGAERLLVDLAIELSRKGCRNQLFVVLNAAYDEAMVAALRVSGFPVVLVERPPGHKHPKYLGQLLGLVREHGIKTIHAHNIGSKFWATLAKLLAKDLKLVVTVHNTGIVPSMGLVHRWLHSTMVDMTVAVSGAVLRECHVGGLKSCVLVHNGIDVARFHRPDRIKVLEGDQARIVCVGRYLPQQKGQDVLIEASAMLHEAGYGLKIDLVGPRTTKTRQGRQQLAEMVSRTGLQDMIGFVEGRSDMPEIFAQADMAVLPSRHEGFGLVIVEVRTAVRN